MSDSTEILGQSELDLRGVMCPYNYVKTKLKLETMQSGQILSVILDEGEPMRNVHRSVLNDGHKIVKQEKIDHAYRLLIKKQN